MSIQECTTHLWGRVKRKPKVVAPGILIGLEGYEDFPIGLGVFEIEIIDENTVRPRESFYRFPLRQNQEPEIRVRPPLTREYINGANLSKFRGMPGTRTTYTWTEDK